jgi:drug/metabolite transporter (DMT)-like permease
MDRPKSTPKYPIPGVLLAFVGLVILAGSNPVAVRFSNQELPPFWGAALRFMVAALIYWGIVILRRLPLPRGRALLGAILYGIFGFGLFMGAMYWALQKVNPGVVSVFLAMAPLLTFFFALFHRQEKFRWAGLIGALVALAGFALGLGGRIGGAGAIPIGFILVLVFGVACQAYATVVYKLFPRSNPSMVNALAMSTGALMLAFISLAAGEAWGLPQAPATWAAFAYLTVLGSVVVFYLQLFVLNRWTATATSYAFLLFPVVTVIISAWLTGEVVTLQFVAGTAIVLVGVWIGVLTPTVRAPAARAPTVLAPANPAPCPEGLSALQMREAGCQD